MIILTWLPFALAAPALWAASNLIDTRLLEEDALTPLALLVLTGSFMGLPALTLILIEGLTWPGWQVVLSAAGAGLLGLLAYLPYFYALRRAAAPAVLVMWNLTPVFIVIGAAAFLDETLSLRQYLAIPLLTVSSVLGALVVHGRAKLSPAFPLMLGASLLLAGASILEKATFEATTFGIGIAWISLFSFSTAAIVVAAHSGVRVALRRQVRMRIAGAVATNHILDVGAFMALSAATSLGPVSLVHAVGSLQPLFLLLFQFRVPRQSRSVAVVAAVGLAAIGLALAEH
jgi:drug/metabolite transporter (DMT)-like permease